jgi:hypothetical protein
VAPIVQSPARAQAAVIKAKMNRYALIVSGTTAPGATTLDERNSAPLA